jgi:penicillin amidase
MRRNRTVAAILGLSLMLSMFVAPAFTQDQDWTASIRRTMKKEKLNLDGEEITIVRDEYGVPHIMARTQRGAYYGGGYAIAQDRLFQLERFRRNARGRLCEIDGLRAYRSDEQMRTNGYSEAQIQAQFDALPQEIKVVFQAYSDGINAWVRRAVQENKLPKQFADAGISQPAPWSPVDSAAIGILMAQRFGSHGGSETQNATILKWLKKKFGVDAEKVFGDIFWINDPKAYTTIADSSQPATRRANGGASRADLETSERLLELDRLGDRALLEAGEMAQQLAAIDYAANNELPTRWGSYACAISPERAVGGSAILLAGPEMGFTTPSIAYEIHYSAAGFNVIGMCIPGIPEVLVGFNDHLAWTATTGFTDVVDIFAEKLNPNNKYQYFYKGQYRDMQKRVESIKIKGMETARQLEVYTTVHGPVAGWDEEAGVAYSRAAAYTGHELEDVIAVYGFGRARNVAEFAEAAALHYTNRNYLVATVEGDIGYWHCGKIPIRARGIDRRLPAPGTGEYEWQGLIEFSKMPQAVNPKEGYFINWNNKPAKNWDNGDQAEWGEVHYVNRIEQLIKAQDRLSLDHVREIAEDIGTYDLVAAHVRPYILSAIEKTGALTRDARVKMAAGYIRAWDGHIRNHSVASTIMRLAAVHVRDLIFSDDLGELNQVFPFRYGPDSPLQHFMQMSIVMRALDAKKAGLALSRDYLNGKGRDQVVLDALNKSMDLTTSVVGPQMNLWKWQQCEINFRGLPPIPNMNRGTYIAMIELSKPVIRGESVLPPGQSEDPASPHFGDQRETAGYWRFKDMMYKREQFSQQSLHERECGTVR